MPRLVVASTDSSHCLLTMFSHSQGCLFSLLGLLLIATAAHAKERFTAISQDFIDHINSFNSTWRAGKNFVPDVKLSCSPGVFGDHPDARLPFQQENINSVTDNDLPTNFDSREQWPFCPSIGEIQDQGSCASGWAIAAVDAMTDRECIHSNGSSQFRYSADDVVSCLQDRQPGCECGFSARVWKYWLYTGIVSGGNYGSTKGCRPYQIKPCSHYVNGSRPPCEESSSTPLCETECIPEYNKSYYEDQRNGKSAYSVPKNEKAIMKEIMTNGPVQSTFWVYEDLLTYKSGVYQHVTGNAKCIHDVRMLGWGVENGTPYWLIANSWNTDWGDNGFFRIKRGNDECRIESIIMAGIPRLYG